MIIQFGTSRFLQAHVDLFATEASAAGQKVPEIVIVQISADPERAKRLPAFADKSGFPVILRGVHRGVIIDRVVQVRSVTGGLSARGDWDALRDIFVHRARYIVSNSGDTGFIPTASDYSREPNDIPQSFCGTVLALLHARWTAGKAGLTFLPCELVPSNATTLCEALMKLATDRQLEPSFVTWLHEANIWADTLVDRIVSEPLEPAGAIAEPYALWAVADRPGLELPFSHPAIVLTKDLEPFERLKLHILNLGHSWLAQRWQARGASKGMTVRGILGDPVEAAALLSLYSDEIIPAFEIHGLGEAARDYMATTLDRFSNPYLDHQLADIFQNHRSKLEKRVCGLLRWVDGSGREFALPRLRSWVGAALADAA